MRIVKEMTFEARLDVTTKVTAFVDEQLEAFSCPLKMQMQIDVAVDEIFSNIARYAYPDGQGEAAVRVEFEPQTRTVSIIFTDGGIPYDPTTNADPDVTLPAEDRAVGGLGIFLVKKLMDSVDYVRQDGKNILRIRKNLG